MIFPGCLLIWRAFSKDRPTPTKGALHDTFLVSPISISWQAEVPQLGTME